MEFLHKTNIDFLKKRYLAFVLSGLIIVSGMVSLFLRGGLNLGIDFKGGTLLQLSFNQEIDIEKLRSALASSDISGTELQSSQNNSVIMRIKKTDLTEEEYASKVETILKSNYPEIQINVERAEYVGPTVGKHLVKQALSAIIFSLLGIIVYVAFRFHSGVWGFAGVLALTHDVFIVISLFSIFNFEITLTIIAALLTLAGYSINDTIVVFDRIRENTRLLTKEELGNVINKSINQTLSRTIITSLTAFFVALTLFIAGGEVIHDFAFALLCGIVIGTYSTIYIASPLVYEWGLYQKRRIMQLRGKRF